MICEGGLTFFLDIANEKTDHLWMILTDRDADGQTVIVMLTDVINVMQAELSFEAHLRLADGFATKKACCVDFARAKMAPTAAIDRILASPAARGGTGHLLPAILASVRSALLSSRSAPPAVVRYCRGLGWPAD